MTQQHPITPPPELVKQWREAPEFSALSPCVIVTVTNTKLQDIATQAARWGADEELEACRTQIIDGVGRVYIEGDRNRVLLAEDIWTARRPKPPSLKEQALALLDPSNTYGSMTQEDEYRISVAKAEIIRRALEQLDG